MIDKGKKMSDKLSVLKDYFGHDSFRDGQEQIVDALLCLLYTSQPLC